MDSPPLDQSHDPFLGFASEASVTPTPDREPAFLRIPTPYEGHLSITSTAADQPSSQPVSARPITTVAVVFGVIAGFAGGYVFADRIIGPGTPAHRIAASAPAPAPAPSRTAAAVPTIAPAESIEPAKPTPEPSTELARGPSVVKATEVADAAATKAVSAPRARPRAPVPSSTKRASTTPRPGPTAAPTTALGGAIEIMSRPRDAQVLLDGIAVGRAPMSIANVPEGTHEVRVELDGFKPWVGSVRVKGGSRARVGASLEQ